MKIIGLDSSGLVASVAVWEDGCILAQYTTNHKKTHSQTLLPMLEQVKKMLDLDLQTVDAIAIAAGPGSYTGLRIGSATAKGLGLALDIPLIEVPTLDGLAYHLWGTDRIVCPLMDARRGQVYAGIYRVNGEVPEPILPQSAILLTEVLDKLNEIGERVVLLGDGVPVYREQIREGLTVPYEEAPAHMNRQSADVICTLGAKLLAEGKTVAASEHAPIYLRTSQAEKEGPQNFKI